MTQILPPVPGRDGEIKTTREGLNPKGDGSEGRRLMINNQQKPDRICITISVHKVNY